MVFIATFWAAVVNLVLLVVALALHPASLDGFHWLRDLPWAWFGTEVGGMLDMQAVDAGALWALWMCVSGALLAGSALAYAVLETGSKPAFATPVAQPQAAAMFSDLRNGMEGLGGFGTAEIPALAPAAELPRHQHPAHEIHLADAASDAPMAPTASQSDKAQDIAASLQQIDPQLSASYDALLRELESPRSL
jgi:hypothetical protein